jgi:hypothetical protein
MEHQPGHVIDLIATVIEVTSAKYVRSYARVSQNVTSQARFAQMVKGRALCNTLHARCQLGRYVRFSIEGV